MTILYQLAETFAGTVKCVEQLPGGVYRLQFRDGTIRNATQAEIDAATALDAAEQSDATQWQTDRETLKTQIAQEIADIDTFLAIASPNNAAVLAEVRAIDRRLKAILKYIRRL